MKISNVVQVFYTVETKTTGECYRYTTGAGSTPFRGGSAHSKASLLRCLPKAFPDCSIELHEVESLIPLAPVKPRNPNNGLPALQSNDIDELFKLHRRFGIALIDTVNLACKCLGLNAQELSQESGYGQDYLHLTIKGEMQPSEDFKAFIREKIGVNPWVYAQDAAVIVLQRESLISVSRDTELS